MGVNLRDLFPMRPVPDGWYAGKRIAVDGPNVAFRYLASLRGPDGDVLRNPSGRAVGHLIGYLNLVRHLRERGAEPVVVWDGAVHPRKRDTVEVRILRRVEAALEADAALASGDAGAHRRLLRASTYLDAGMIRDCTQLLETLGVAVVRADHDAERYAAALCLDGKADAVATEDYDALVAGAPVVLRKAGSPEPAMQLLSDLPAALGPRELRWIAILCGTDWNPGVRGLGAKTAMRLLRDHPDLPALLDEALAGRGESRWHRLLGGSGMSRDEFRDLDAFIADLPKVTPPRPARPDPEAAAKLADAWGLDRKRTIACFC